MNIVIKNDQLYKQYGTRLRKICSLENCNYICSSSGFCKKHTIKDTEKICKTCLAVKNNTYFLQNDEICIICKEKLYRNSPEFKPYMIIKNGVRYMQYSTSIRKLCKLENCNAVSSGEFCRKHKEQIIKTDEKKCNRCFNIKPISEFKNDNNVLDYTHCVHCRNYNKKSSLITHDKRRRFLLQVKIDMGGNCVDCNITDLEILEFDHVKGNKKTELVRIYNNKDVLEESKKCVLRCANCHFIKTKATIVYDKIDVDNKKKSVEFCRKYRKLARDYVDNVKINTNGCVSCGWYDINNLQVLHFDHEDKNTKEYNIGRLTSTGASLKIIETEIKKCKLLCANCHRKRTMVQFNYPILNIIKNL